eukprot:CAMPEP_0197516550 /NCGR_PEP_ID=MMETSP1318-20131121/1445_1 /TAXON_ID=552666 /ORGANISM="Partenskyella glossopodia, Strain RCC365" /LENGTH=620 /DNA_ID=CAMNT_0043065385 /DNA_START=58 /DNA_END=1917 /DNA_ORIENTATION=-
MKEVNGEERKEDDRSYSKSDDSSRGRDNAVGGGGFDSDSEVAWKRYYTPEAFNGRKGLYHSDLVTGQINRFWHVYKKNGFGKVTKREYCKANFLMQKALQSDFDPFQARMIAHRDWECDSRYNIDQLLLESETISSESDDDDDDDDDSSDDDDGNNSSIDERSENQNQTQACDDSDDKKKRRKSRGKRKRLRMKRLSRLRDLDYRQMRKSVFEIADKWTDKISALGYAVFLHRLLLSVTVAVDEQQRYGKGRGTGTGRASAAGKGKTREWKPIKAVEAGCMEVEEARNKEPKVREKMVISHFASPPIEIHFIAFEAAAELARKRRESRAVRKREQEERGGSRQGIAADGGGGLSPKRPFSSSSCGDSALGVAFGSDSLPSLSTNECHTRTNADDAESLSTPMTTSMSANLGASGAVSPKVHTCKPVASPVVTVTPTGGTLPEAICSESGDRTATKCGRVSTASSFADAAHEAPSPSSPAALKQQETVSKSEPTKLTPTPKLTPKPKPKANSKPPTEMKLHAVDVNLEEGLYAKSPLSGLERKDLRFSAGIERSWPQSSKSKAVQVQHRHNNSASNNAAHDFRHRRMNISTNDISQRNKPTCKSPLTTSRVPVRTMTLNAW